MFSGTWLQGCRHGDGVFTFATGQKLQGEFRNDSIYNGTGAFVEPDGTVFEGSWKEGKRVGVGKYINVDGSVWEGKLTNEVIKDGTFTEFIGGAALTFEVARGTKTGKWKIVYANGDEREGVNKNLLHSTSGVFLSTRGNVNEGFFIDGRLHGAGKKTTPQGYVLEGEFVNGKILNGHGTIVSSEGHRYDGEFKNGRRDGLGVFVSVDGSRHEGEFRGGKIFNGHGSVRLMVSGDLFEGTWVEGKLHGPGKITYGSGGHVLEGEFRSGLIYNGKGSVLKHNKLFVGEWTNGVLNGPGSLTFVQNGKKKEGIFRNWILTKIV
jgi:hypothetical protein